MSSKKTSNSSLVYSTDHGRMCSGCGHPADRCACSGRKSQQAGQKVGQTPSQSSLPKNDGIVRISRQTKGRKGKGVSCVTGVPLPPDKLEELAKQLKQRCGAGGTVRDGVIEIQGDHRELLGQELKKLGYTVKLAGG